MATKLQISLEVIDKWLSYRTKQGDWPGAQVSIRSKAELIFNKSYGYADIEKKEKYSVRHMARLASQSKTVASTLTLILDKEGFLQLNDVVESYIPELKKHRNSSVKKITLLDLMTNRSGLIRDSYRNNYWGSLIEFPNKKSLINEILKTDLINKPAKQIKYSNIGYSLLGVALETAGQKTYEALLGKFFKISLKAFGLHPEFNKKLKMAKGYLRVQSSPAKYRPIKHRDTGALMPAAGMCGTTQGSTDFFYNLYGTNNILSKQQRKKIFNTKYFVPGESTDEYGLGTIFRNICDVLYVGHSGGFPGFSSQTWYVPKTKLSFGFAVNTSANTFNNIKGMQEIIKRVSSTFTTAELKSVVVSDPMIDNSGATIYVVGRNKAISFSLNTVDPTEVAVTFKRKKGKFYAQKLSAYRAIGEPIKFLFKNKKIKAVNFGGFVSYPLN